MSTDPQSRSIAELTKDLTWLAALIVTVALGAIAGVLALLGKQKVAAASPPVPEQTMETVKADVAEAKTRAQEGRA